MTVELTLDNRKMSGTIEWITDKDGKILEYKENLVAEEEE